MGSELGGGGGCGCGLFYLKEGFSSSWAFGLRSVAALLPLVVNIAFSASSQLSGHILSSRAYPFSMSLISK